MKKVGIMTFFRPINNGAVLQACATSRIVLPKLGYKAEIIDYRLERIETDRSMFGIDRVLRENGTLKKVRRVFADLIRLPVNYKQTKIFDSFIIKHLPVGSDVFYSEGDLKERCQGYDAYIVGSDLVWSPTMAEGVNPVYFLAFVDKSKLKIAYAPSVGTTDLTDKDIRDFRSLLSNLDAISVREKSSAIQLRNLTGYDMKAVLDPTLLTDCADWDEFYDSQKLVKDKYVFAFALEASQILVDTVNCLAKEADSIVIAYGRKNKLYRARKVIFLDGECGPSEFLNYIRNADTVVTNSFHGCAFSVVFRKEFYCIPHTTRGVRMVDLLKELNLEKRIIKNATNLPKDKIDYKKVEQKLSILRDDSLGFLKDSLGTLECR